MKKLFFIALIILSLFNSCDDIFENADVKTGRCDSSYLYREFSPPLKIETELDSITNFYFGKDSIDFDFDGNFDALIITQFQENDSLAKINHLDVNSFFRIYFKNGYEPAIREMPYSCGHGMCNTIPLIYPIEFDVDVKNVQYLGKDKTSNILWLKNPVHLSGTLTWWYNIESDKMYIGIRRAIMSLENRPYYRYGWIEVDATSLKNISFTSFAIEQ